MLRWTATSYIFRPHGGVYNLRKAIGLTPVGPGPTARAVITDHYDQVNFCVMEIDLAVEGRRSKAVFKVYDRWYMMRRDARGQPHGARREFAWRDYVRTGKAKALISRLERKQRRQRHGLYDDEVETLSEEAAKSDWEKLGEEEGRLYYECHKARADETLAYLQLHALQGECIPEFIAEVTCKFRDSPVDLDEQYFTVPGIIIEHLRGYTIARQIQEMPSREAWQRLIQDTVNAVNRINDQGVLLPECNTRNVLAVEMEDDTFSPFLLNFTNVDFDWQYVRGPDGEKVVEFRKRRAERDNPREMGSALTKLVWGDEMYATEIKY